MKTDADGTITYFPLGSTSEVAVAWYLEVKIQPQGNIMAMVFRDGPNDPWKVVVRIRIYADDKVHASKDWRHGHMVYGEKDDLVKQTDILMDGLKEASRGELTRIDEHESIDEFMEIWTNQPWAHKRTEYIH